MRCPEGSVPREGTEAAHPCPDLPVGLSVWLFPCTLRKPLSNSTAAGVAGALRAVPAQDLSRGACSPRSVAGRSGGLGLLWHLKWGQPPGPVFHLWGPPQLQVVRVD